MEVARLFIGLGLPVCQGYGLTEASPAVCFNPPEDNEPATIGRPLPGIEVAVGADDELLVRGPTVMLGYWNDPAATARAIDTEGWLHTGDQARIEAGRVTITGRIKDILVLSNGEKVPPVAMEAEIALDPLFDQVLVVGEGRPFLALLAVINAEVWPIFCARNAVDPAPASLADRRVQHLLLERVAARLHAFPGFAKVRRLHATLAPWTIDDGLVTPTLKLKRAAVLRQFAAEVDALYAGE
jgi:long-chain acyl-CoA synthetase